MMRVLHIHQHYRIRGGEDAMVEATVAALRRHGVDARLLSHDSASITGLAARARAFFSGIYSPAAGKAMLDLIGRERPDLLHVHNLHPQFSPAVLVAARRAGLPVVMTCHNYRLVCPAGMHMRGERICTRCLGGKELWCLLGNCKGNLFESAGCALRGSVHRQLGLYPKYVTRFIAVSRFVRDWLAEAGLPGDRLCVIPNMVAIPPEASEAEGNYVAFAGRFTPQKGIRTLLLAARRTGLPFRLAGDPAPMANLLRGCDSNIQLSGVLGSQEMAEFYRQSRLVVVPSECLEPFGLVAAEAMSHGRTVIASRIGGLTEIVEDGVTGLLVEPGKATDLADRIHCIWDDTALRKRLGLAGRDKSCREWSEARYLERLVALYEDVLDRSTAGVQSGMRERADAEV